jgi:hypothetical protein
MLKNNGPLLLLCQDPSNYFLDCSIILRLNDGVFFFIAVDLDSGSRREVGVELLFSVCPSFSFSTAWHLRHLLSFIKASLEASSANATEETSISEEKLIRVILNLFIM